MQNVYVKKVPKWGPNYEISLFWKAYTIFIFHQTLMCFFKLIVTMTSCIEQVPFY